MNRGGAWDAGGSKAGAGDVPEQPVSAARPPSDRIRILLLAANPLSTGRLAIDEEVRSIEHALRLSRDRDRFEVIPCSAVRPDDLLQYLNQYRPQIVHFSGHGAATGHILLSAGDGTDQPVEAAALDELFRVMSDGIRIVLFNACYTTAQAEAIHWHIDFVIGTTAAITDEQATVFAAAFYSALGFGQTVPRAFAQARAALTVHGLTGQEIPELLVRPNAKPGLLPADSRLLRPEEYEARMTALVADVPNGEHPAEPHLADRSAGRAGRFQGARSQQRRPAVPPEPTFVVTYAAADADYGTRLVDWLKRSGLPSWSIADLAWGNRWAHEVRQRLRHALAVVVVMSPAAEDSEDVEREILEGQWYGREFFPVLLFGDRHFLLASTWYFDARGESGGVMPGEAELRRLRQIYQAHLTGRRADPPRPMTLPVPAPVARIPEDTSLRKLRDLLEDREFAHADLFTTSLVLASAGRLDTGWMGRADAHRLTDYLLTAIDAAWSERTGGRQGFKRQLNLYRLKGEGSTEFLNLAEAYGWKSTVANGPRFGEAQKIRTYHEFIDRSPVPAGFFPTLRNRQSEVYGGWYDRWRKTVIALHLRLRGSEREWDSPWT